MKKLYTYTTSFLLLVFLLFPGVLALCRPRRTMPKGMAEAQQGKADELFVTCLNVKTNEVLNVDLEEHLVGVLAAEMPAAYEPESLKAQAVAARSYIISKSNVTNPGHPAAAICTDSNHCKGWLSLEEADAKWKPEERDKNRRKLQKAVKATRGEYMIYQDEVVEAFFFAASGGKTENSEDVWSTSLPYLRSVKSPEDEASANYRSSAVFTLDEFCTKISPYVSGELPAGAAPSISAPKRTEGGSVAQITICGKTFKGSEIRSIFGLKSANFTVEVSEDKVRFDVVGYGHGVGMSQTGANEMAKLGKKYTEILKHYYTNIQIVKM